MTNNHPHPKWLQAYHDHELTGLTFITVEDHLLGCETCRNELKKFEELSEILHDFSRTAGELSPQIFTAQVGLRLPRKHQGKLLQKILRQSWRLAPVGILSIWAFTQAAFIVSGLISQVLRFLPNQEIFSDLTLLNQIPSTAGMFQLSDPSLLDLSRMGLALFTPADYLGWGLTLNLGLTMIIGMIYISWLSTWWINSRDSRGSVPSNGHQSTQRSVT